MDGLVRALSQLRIATRLRASFALLLALPLLMAALAVQRLQDLSDAYAHLVDEQAELLATAGEVSENADDAARKVLVLLGSSPELRRLLVDEIDAADRRLEAAAELLRHRIEGEAGQRALSQLRDSMSAYRSQLAATVADLDGGRRQAAEQRLSIALEPALNTLVGATRRLLESLEAVSIQQARRLREQIEADRALVLLLCAIALAGGALLAVLVARSVLRPLARADAGAQAIAAGDYGHRIAVVGRDELSRLSASMNELAVAVDDRQRRLFDMAGTDALTGLALRTRFAAAVDQQLGMHARSPAALLCLDVDRLKLVNNVLGFEAGDSLLLGLSRRLEQLQTEGAICGRLAGGTFVVWLPLQSAEAWQPATAQLHAALNRRQQWQGQILDLTVSIGVALCPAHGLRAEALLQRAEQAMFEAKRLRTEVTLYDPELEADRLSHLSLLSELETAIQQGQLRQFLQPKLSLLDDSIAGAEALVRWHHPTRGWLPPSEFVPFAESTGRIRQITQWMLEQAITTLAAWGEQGLELPIAVNLSTLDLQDSQLPARIQAMLERAKVPAHLLQLELTETGLMASTQDPIHVMHSLRRLGVRLAIDDFGTGQSSLAYLQRLPVHELKIDRSFIDGVDQDQQREALLNSIVMLGHGLGLKVTAEGVETAAELELLRRLGCDLAQGYLIAKPMDAPLFDGWCRRAPSLPLALLSD
jgi:diguanylate cyclase (GGDEF)-like protein